VLIIKVVGWAVARSCWARVRCGVVLLVGAVDGCGGGGWG